MDTGPLTIRTMKTDTEELLKKEKTSFLDLFEQQANEKKEHRYRLRHQQPRTKTSTRSFFIATFLIILLGSFSGIFFYFQNETSTPVPHVFNPPRSIINAQKTEVIKVNRNDRTGLLLKLNEQKSTSRGSVDFIYTPITLVDIGVEQFLSSPKEFFVTLNITPPSDFFDGITERWNAFASDNNYIFVFEIKNDPQSRAKVTGSVRRWEETMPRSFGTTLLKDLDPGLHTFNDEFYKNIHIRIAPVSSSHDIANAEVLGKYLIIATSESTIKTTIDRFIAGPINE